MWSEECGVRNVGEALLPNIISFARGERVAKLIPLFCLQKGGGTALE